APPAPRLLVTWDCPDARAPTPARPIAITRVIVSSVKAETVPRIELRSNIAPEERFSFQQQREKPSPSVFTAAHRRRLKIVHLLAPWSGEKWKATLELEVEFALHRPGAKGFVCTPEVRVRDIAVDFDQVHLVKHVERIRADLE